MQTTQNWSDLTRPAVNTYCYDAYGQLLGDIKYGGGLSNVPFGSVGFGGEFGYHQDPETGLYQLGARYYDAGKGRFVTRDPIGYGGGANLYGFCGNNPVNRADPSGDNAIILYGTNVGSWPHDYFKTIAMSMAAEYDKQTMEVESYENGLTGGHAYPTYDRAYVFDLGKSPDSRAAFQSALKSVSNIDEIIYVGHAGITSLGLSELYCGPGPVQELDFGDVRLLDTHNVASNAGIFLDGCDTAATRDPKSGVPLKTGTPTIAQAFANHFGTNVGAFSEHVSMGAPYWCMPFYDYDTHWHVGLRFSYPITVAPTK